MFLLVEFAHPLKKIQKLWFRSRQLLFLSRYNAVFSQLSPHSVAAPWVHTAAQTCAAQPPPRAYDACCSYNHRSPKRVPPLALARDSVLGPRLDSVRSAPFNCTPTLRTLMRRVYAIHSFFFGNVAIAFKYAGGPTHHKPHR